MLRSMSLQQVSKSLQQQQVSKSLQQVSKVVTRYDELVFSHVTSRLRIQHSAVRIIIPVFHKTTNSCTKTYHERLSKYALS